MIQPTANAILTSGSFDDFVARLAGGGRSSVNRHLAACEKEADDGHIRLWKRLVGLLGRLTPDAAPVAGARAVQFYVPDGKYKLQVFAVEDLRDGDIALYSKDTRELALRDGVLAGYADAHAHLYHVGGGFGGSAGEDQLKIQPLTAATTNFAPEYYKHMLDWNRTAIRITLFRNSTSIQLRAAEAICALAAGLFAAPAPRS